MPEVQDVISLPHIPIGLIHPKGRETTFADVAKFLSKNPSPFQKVTYLTLGGFVAAICGGVTALVSKAGSTFGGVLALIGLAAVGIGYHFSPSQVKDAQSIGKPLVNKDEVITANGKEQTAPISPDPKILEEAKIKELTEKLTSEKDYKKRKEAVEELIEIGGDSIINALLQSLGKEKIIRVRTAIVTGLGKIGNSSCLETLNRIVSNKTESDGIRQKAGKAIDEIALREASLNGKIANHRLLGDNHTTNREAGHRVKIDPVIIPEQD